LHEKVLSGRLQVLLLQLDQLEVTAVRTVYCYQVSFYTLLYFLVSQFLILHFKGGVPNTSSLVESVENI